MPCIAVVMAQKDNHSFAEGDVIEVLEIDKHIGSKIYKNPKFKIIKLPDTEKEEAESLLEPEYDIFMNVITQRKNTLEVDEIPSGNDKDSEPELSKVSMLSKIKVKIPKKDIQTEPEVVG